MVKLKRVRIPLPLQNLDNIAEISISIGIVIAVFIPVIIAILVEKKKINSIRVGQVWFTEKHFNPFLRHKRRVRVKGILDGWVKLDDLSCFDANGRPVRMYLTCSDLITLYRLEE